ncbi:MAG TPA: thiamine diphosphokinase [Devosiaceae bacterium]|jgi:thiamine pyrophosphokinase
MQVPRPDAKAAPLLVYDDLLVIVGGGSLDAGLLRRLAAQGAHLVGADGGGDAIAAAGLVPEAIIGDLDSLVDAASWGERTTVVRVKEQITTDFEKCLYSTRAPVTVALGMTGRRFDHTLSAISAVTRYARERRIILVDESDIALAVSGPFGFAAESGERVSVYPLLPIEFLSSSGLLYPLNSLRLEAGGLIGTSNAASAERVEIVPADQTPWLLILDRRHLDGLVAGILGEII